MIPQVTLRKTLSDPNLLGNVLGGDSWSAWRAILLASMGEKLNAGELETFRKLTGRERPPDRRVDELVCVVGRRGGKSSAIAALAVYIAALCKRKLAPGETGLVICVAPDQKQARVCLDYCAGIMENTPMLAGLIANRTADTLELTNGHCIEVRSSSFRRLRGFTGLAVIADEAAFWMSENSTNPDTEILAALRPALATTQGMVTIISSPYARKGELWELYRRHYGPDGDPAILVAQGTSRDFNPELDEKVVRRALERDESAARAEYFAEFRTDLEGYVALEEIRACVTPGTKERAPENRNAYVGFTDPSGGSGDSFTLAIMHKEGKVAVLDAVREIRPPFSPEAATAELSAVLRQYRCSQVFGDRYAGEWPREQFRKHGVYYEPAEKSKSELYTDMLPWLNSRNVDLLDNDRLVMQITGLERRTGRSGKDSIDHGPGGRDDLANAVAGALAMLDRRSSSDFYRELEYPKRAMW
jgi:hypothetical protein